VYNLTLHLVALKRRCFSHRIKLFGINFKFGIKINNTEISLLTLVSTTFDSEALKFISDVIISDTTDRGKGGFSAMVSALEYSRTIYKNLLRMVNYLTTSQLSRIFIILGALILGFTALTPIQLLVSGLAIDLAAIIASAFSKPPFSSLSLRDNAEEALKKPFAMNMRSTLFALFEAMMILSVYPVYTRIGIPFTPEQYISTAFIAFVVCRFVTFIELATERGVFKSGMRMGISFILFLLFAAGFVASCMLIPPFGKLFGVVSITAELAIAVVFIGLATFTVHEIYKLLSKEKYK